MNKTSNIEKEFFSGRAWLVKYPRHADHRGFLDAFDFDWMPFMPCRMFAITEVPPGTVRGRHMHSSGMQMLICLHGRIEILMRYHDEERSAVLDPESPALVFQSGVWCQQKYLQSNSILIAFASEPYTPQGYIDHWNLTESPNRGYVPAPGHACDD